SSGSSSPSTSSTSPSSTSSPSSPAEPSSIVNFPHLHSLYLSHNKIADLNELEHLANFLHVKSLTLTNHVLARKTAYRSVVLRSFPSVTWLDGTTVSVEERLSIEAATIQLLATSPT